jgi:RNA polymerase sigma factor (sigma-70 family)
MEQTQTHGELLIRARDGDQRAWAELVERMSPLVWSVTRSFRLDQATATDVAQTVWLRLVEQADSIRDPERLPGWLATTCRREAMHTIDKSKRAIPSEFERDVPDLTISVESSIVEKEEHQALRVAFDTLSEDDQQLLRLMVIEPPLTYEEISEVIGRPVGSLGPTRARALERLRRAMEDGPARVAA